MTDTVAEVDSADLDPRPIRRKSNRRPLWVLIVVPVVVLLLGFAAGALSQQPRITALEKANHSLTTRLHAANDATASAQADAGAQRDQAAACKSAYDIATKAGQSIAASAADVDGSIGNGSDLSAALDRQTAIIQGAAAHMLDAQDLGCE